MASSSMLDVLLDIYEDKNAEMKLTRENIKAFIMVSVLVMSALIEYITHEGLCLSIYMLILL